MRAFIEKYGEALFIIIIAASLIFTCIPLTTVTKNAIKNNADAYLEHYEESDYSKSAPGLYDDNMKLIATWGTLTGPEKMGGYNMDIKTNYTLSTYNSTYSPYTILNKEEFKEGTILVIDSHIEEIGEYAFFECDTLKKIILPNTISRIRPMTFSQMDNIELIKLPQNITIIAKQAFYKCPKLSIIVNANVETIVAPAFIDIKTVCYNGALNLAGVSASKLHLDTNSDGKCELCGYNDSISIVEFNYKGGKGSEVKIKEVSYNQPYGDLPSITKEGYTFGGWFTSKNYEDDKQVTKTDVVAIKGDHTLYAKWIKKDYTVTFNLNKGSGSTNPECSTVSKTVTYGENYGALPKATRKGYTLSGWYTAEIGGSKVTSYTKVRETINHTLYAQWAPLEYEIKFDLNKGSGETVPTCEKESMLIKFDSTYNGLPLPTRVDYKFDGWFTEASGGEQVKDTTIVEKIEEHTLYAHWTKTN